MRYLKSYNESIKHLLKPKSDDQVLNELEKLSDSGKIIKIIKYNLPYSLLPDNLTINGNLYWSDNKLTKLPDNLTINGDLYCSKNQLTKLPDNLTVKGGLYCSHNQLPKNTKKPKGVKGELYL